MIASTEWRFADKQLVYEDAQCPVVDRTVMTLVQDDFGRNVLGRSGECPGFLVGIDAFGKSKVNLNI